jgi:hypothetical protein
MMGTECDDLMAVLGAGMHRDTLSAAVHDIDSPLAHTIA